MPTKVKDEITTLIETLEALYYLTQSLDAHSERINWIRDNFRILSRADLYELRDELKREVKDIRRQAGAIAKDAALRKASGDIHSQASLVYVSKLQIDKMLFTQYAKVFPRWPHVKKHALVVFDPKTNKGLRQIFEIEGVLFKDARLLLEHAREAAGNISDFRERSEDDQRRLHGYLRSLVPVLFNFLEAYLNGLAYDCFHTFHDSLSLRDHDRLGEWDSQKKQIKGVKLDDKIFKYPRIVCCASAEMRLSARCGLTLPPVGLHSAPSTGRIRLCWGAT